MPTPHERAAQLWHELTCQIPIEHLDDEDYQALARNCQAIIVNALVPPIDKTEAWEQLMATLDTFGMTDEPPIIEAIYVYREALLKWQREVIDAQARDAELAIRTLRGYTKGRG